MTRVLDNAGEFARRMHNALRRRMDFGLTAFKYALRAHGTHPADLLRLHLGCGNRHLDGYVNIDFRKTAATDLTCDIRRLPYPAGSVGVIETYHVIEHLPRHDLPHALTEWHRVLAPGGRLIIECPDFDAAVKEYLEGNARRIDNIFGLQRFPGDTHLFGYNFPRLKEILAAAGFIQIERTAPQDYHTGEEPCLRVECTRG